MGSDQFEFIFNCLRFDDKQTRAERKKIGLFAPAEKLWETFTETCHTKLNSGAYVTINDQLLGFRGKVPLECTFLIHQENID